MIGRASSLLCAAVLLAATPLRAAPNLSSDGPVELSLTARLGIPRGTVQVRENQTQGTKLHLHGDLGIDTSESVTLAGAFHLTSDDALRLAFESVFLYGGTRLSDDVFFNGARLQGGTDLDSRPEFFRLTGLYERRLFDLPGGGRLSADAGFTYVFLTYKLHGTLSAQTTGGETKEDFLTQELPVPVLGFSLEEPVSRRLSVVGSLLGGYLPLVDSFRREGGEVKVTQSHADLSLGLRYLLARGVSIEGGYRFSYFVQRETSREDGNDFRLLDNGLSAGLVYRF